MAKGKPFTLEEFLTIGTLYPKVENSISESNPEIAELARQLGRTTRAVEAQLLGFRFIERKKEGKNYGRANFSKLLYEAWNQLDLGDPVTEEEINHWANERKTTQGITGIESINSTGIHQDTGGGSVEHMGEDISKHNIEPRCPSEILQERAFAASDVAVDPGREQDDFWPNGPAAPGGQEAIDALIQHAKGPISSPPLWVVLLGGAGNGKSWLARGLVKELGLKHSRSPLAPRLLEGQAHSGRVVRVINDASIEEHDPGKDFPELAHDLTNALDEKVDLLANINRGILIEDELRSEGDNKPYHAGRNIINWLLGTEIDELLLEGNKCEVHDQSHGYIKTLAIQESDSNRKLDIICVNMDHCSLLESIPSDIEKHINVKISNEGKVVSAPRYRIMDLDPGQDNLDRRLESPAADVISKLFRDGQLETLQDSLDPRSPILANIKMLKTTTAGILNILRGAEIARSSPFTYRELWALIAIACNGPPRDEWNNLSPATWIDRQLKPLDDPNTDSLQKLKILNELAEHRLPIALTGTDFPEIICPPVNAIRRVDPCLTPAPSELFDAIDCLRIEESPSKQLMRNDPQFKAIWSRFDEELETATLEVCRTMLSSKDEKKDEKERRRLIARYGRYIHRLHAFVHGQPGYFKELCCWTRWWIDASINDYVDDELTGAVKRLLLPQLTEDSKNTALRALTSRVEPIRGEPLEPELALAIEQDDVMPTARTDGDTLLLLLKDRDTKTVLAEMPVDLVLLRELAISVNKGGGFTDSSNDAMPLIERARASLTSTDKAMRRMKLVSQDLNTTRVDWT